MTPRSVRLVVALAALAALSACAAPPPPPAPSPPAAAAAKPPAKVRATFVNMQFAMPPDPRPGQSIADVLTPAGTPVGFPGARSGEFILFGDDNFARQLFDRLTPGAATLKVRGFDGIVRRLPTGTIIRLRSGNANMPPAILLNVPNVPIHTLAIQYPVLPPAGDGGSEG